VAVIPALLAGRHETYSDKESDPSLKIVEITPYRLESNYSDKRHPDNICFANKLELDLKRRDFTINAMAIEIQNAKYKNQNNNIKFKIIDLFGGKENLKNKIIKAVGNPEQRFKEDALRILRAVRLGTELGFTINQETGEAIKKCGYLLEVIAKERIKDEFIKIIMSQKPSLGIEMLSDFGILKYIIPELEKAQGIEQNKAHKYTVWKHSLNSLDHAAMKNFSLEIRLAALLHDIAKPASRYWSKEKNDWTFYGHEVLGAKMSVKILSRLKFSKKTIELAVKLVRYHLFFSDTEIITLSAVRRIVRNVGPENIWDLMKVRFCDRIGMGRPKETPYRLRKYEAMIEEAMRAPLSVSMLKIDGNQIMKLLSIEPGPKIGHILHVLMEEVLDDPLKNTEKWLKKRTKELGMISKKEIEELGEKAKDKKSRIEQKEIAEIRQKWWVK
jgi:poly(A) polymerase/tRNA nucleotidyltransferase (CCA-adding enzyme)